MEKQNKWCFSLSEVLIRLLDNPFISHESVIICQFFRQNAAHHLCLQNAILHLVSLINVTSFSDRAIIV